MLLLLLLYFHQSPSSNIVTEPITKFMPDQLYDFYQYFYSSNSMLINYRHYLCWFVFYWPHLYLSIVLLYYQPPFQLKWKVSFSFCLFLINPLLNAFIELRILNHKVSANTLNFCLLGTFMHWSFFLKLTFWSYEH